MARKYQLINYFDVYGSEKEGYEINNQCVEFDDWYIADDATDKEILDFLVKSAYLKTSDMRQVRIASDGEAMEVYAVKGHFPLFSIMPLY